MDNNERANIILRQRTLIINKLKKENTKLKNLNEILESKNSDLMVQNALLFEENATLKDKIAKPSTKKYKNRKTDDTDAD